MDRFAIIGAGKIAYSLVDAFIKKEFIISCVISRELKSAKILANKYEIENFSNQLSKIPANTNVFIIAVPDNKIKNIAKDLSKLKLAYKNSIFIHLSGALNIKVLKDLKLKGGSVASFHIMQTFPSKKIVKVEDCYVAIESDNAKIENQLFKIAKRLKLNPFKISSGNKSFYHLSGVFASNFLIGNLFNSKEIFNSLNVNDVSSITFHINIDINILNLYQTFSNGRQPEHHLSL
ncbi:MAG: DUF2520 domain-containing protein [Ignavibacteriales bacterium]|nr:DUF2520 domain-containing protein [Ignavibacteriales bacterium]